MQDYIEQIQKMFQNYATNWNKQIYLDQELAESVAEPIQAKPTVQKSIPKRKRLPAQQGPELQEYLLEIQDCRKCALSETRKNFVFGYGNPQAKLMFIGEAPGKDEDEQGIPFVGRAGQLLDKMLVAIGLNRDDVFIANMLKCRPPQNRDPLPDEILKCEPYLLRQLELIKPKVLCALGRVAGQNLLKKEDALSLLRESEHSYNDIPVIVTYHPAALLRNPRWKQNSWQDLKKIKNLLQNS